MLGQKHFKGERVCFAQLGFLVYHGVEVKVVTAGRIYSPYIHRHGGRISVADSAGLPQQLMNQDNP